MGTSGEDKTAVDVAAGEASAEVRDFEHMILQAKPTFGKRILAVIWDSLDKSPKERALIAKLDWFILSYVCVAYFVKYLDQTNVSNAYVSGMREDLKLKGNDLNLLTTYWTIGYILGQFPSQMAMTKIRPSVWLPAMEIIWSILTICVAGANNVQTVYALRFFIGLFEASSYAGIMTLLGNWYQPAELGKRACIFQASSSAAQMFSEYLQAALYSGMNGKCGLPAWKWLFIFDGIIGVPIALYRFWAIPDAPTTTRSRYLNPEEKRIAIERMEAVGRKPAKPLTVKTFKAIFTAWPVYLFTIAFIAHVLEVNLIPTADYGLQIAFTLSYAWTSDAIRMRWPVIIFACLVALAGCIILSVYPEHNIAAMMAGWFLTFCETGAGALFITWINEVCSFSQEHRLVVIAIVETMSFTFNAWVPLLAYNTGEAPKFRYGYKLAAMFFAVEICMVGVILLAQKLKWNVGDEAEREVVEEEST